MIRERVPTISDRQATARARAVRRLPQGRGAVAGLGSLGDYFDGTHTWHFDQAIGDYVNENGDRANPPAPTPAVVTPHPTYSAGSIANASGGATYTGSSNPLLNSNAGGTGFDGSTVHYNPNEYATQAAAQQFATALGGQVVIDPSSQGINGSPMYAVRLPDGTTVNAGAIAMILGNDAAFPGDTTKSGEIAKLFGASYNPNIAAALRSGSSISLTPGQPAPGYLPTPLSQRAASSSAGSSSTATSSGGAYAPHVVLENLTTGNAAVVIAGVDTWRFTVTGGRPNTPVTVTARKNGGAASTATYGKTDAAGNWTMSGKSDAGDAGTWSQSWSVGGTDAGSITVQITTAAAGSSAGSSSTPTGSTFTGRSPFSDVAPSGFNFAAVVDAAKQLPFYVWALAAGAFIFVRRGR
jgi:hypothetical protein